MSHYSSGSQLNHSARRARTYAKMADMLIKMFPDSVFPHLASVEKKRRHFCDVFINADGSGLEQVEAEDRHLAHLLRTGEHLGKKR